MINLNDYPEIASVRDLPKMQEKVRKLKKDPFWKQDFKAKLEETLKTFNWYQSNKKQK